MLPLLEHPESRGVDVKDGKNDAHDEGGSRGEALQVAETQLRVEGFDQLFDFFLIDLISDDLFFWGLFVRHFLPSAGAGVIPPFDMPFKGLLVVSMRSRAG